MALVSKLVAKKINNRRSIAVLDYAADIVNQNPESRIYVMPHCVNYKVMPHCVNYKDRDCANSELASRRTQAIIRYLEQKGVSAKRLISVASDHAAPHISSKRTDKYPKPDTRSPSDIQSIWIIARVM
jgi:hypothetical protein